MMIFLPVQGYLKKSVQWTPVKFPLEFVHVNLSEDYRTPLIQQ